MLEKEKVNFSALSLLGAVYVVTLLLTMVIENRIVLLDGIHILSGTLILPLSYSVSDMITEVYGYKQMRQLIWVSLFTLYLASFVIYLIMSLPTDSTIGRDQAYSIVFSDFLQDIVTYSLAAMSSLFLNAYILSKLKILTFGRYFWLRSMIATAIGEALFIIIWGVLGFSNKFPFDMLLNLMLVSYLFKLIYNVIMIFPISIIVFFLKKHEKKEVFDNNINFTPFSLET